MLTYQYFLLHFLLFYTFLSPFRLYSLITCFSTLYWNFSIKYRNREFWCRGYYVDTVGKNAKKIAEYTKNQLEEDKIGEQMKISYKEDPFMGSK